MHDRRRHCHAGFGTQPIRSHIQCLQGTLSAAAVSAISIDPVEQPCCQGSQSLRPQPFSSLTYVKSTSINLMAGIPSYFSGSNPYLSNLRLAALSTCDLNRSKFSRAPCKSRTLVGSSCDSASWLTRTRTGWTGVRPSTLIQQPIDRELLCDRGLLSRSLMRGIFHPADC